MNKGRVIVRLAGLAIVTAASSGCAFVGHDIKLTYEARDGSADFLERKLPVCVGKFDTSMAPVEPGKWIVGCVRNGYGWKTAKVHTADPPAEWVKKAVSRELAARGYDVVSSPDEQTPTVEGQLANFYLDPTGVAISGQVAFTLRIRQGEEIIHAEPFAGSAFPAAWWGSSREYEKAARECLADGLDKAMPVIAKHLDTLAVEQKVLSQR
jgi:hypothetical protein